MKAILIRMIMPGWPAWRAEGRETLVPAAFRAANCAIAAVR